MSHKYPAAVLGERAGGASRTHKRTPAALVLFQTGCASLVSPAAEEVLVVFVVGGGVGVGVVGVRATGACWGRHIVVALLFSCRFFSGLIR